MIKFSQLAIAIFFLLFSCKQKQVENKITVSDTTISENISVEQQVNIQNDASADSSLITCETIGPIKLSNTYAEIEKQVGNENLKTDSVFVEGEFSGYTVRVWPETTKEINLYFKEERPPFTNITGADIVQPNSIYHFNNGIKIGILLTDLVAKNGNKPINFFGFWWDYGGMISNLNNGDLKTNYPCFSGGLGLEMDGLSEKDIDELAGDMEKSSELPAAKKLPVKLISIRLNKNEAK